MHSQRRRERPDGRRRTQNACSRCRQHKIKCSGTQPCKACTHRGVVCVVGSGHNYSHSYVRNLERRLAAAEQPGQNVPRITPISVEAEQDAASSSQNTLIAARVPGHQHGLSRNHATSETALSVTSEEDSNEPLVNDLAAGRSFYLQDIQGRAIYLGPSSNWSFGRRVLQLAQESIMKVPLDPTSLLWEGKAYDLGWKGHRSSDLASIDEPIVPEADFGMFLVNTARFYVGQLFHLYDEKDFTKHFNQFYDMGCTTRSTDSIWYYHYLLLLAFGKAFIARQQTQDLRPPGCAFFVRAVATLPDLIFLDPHPLEAVEVLCCASLYLHCLDMRRGAYKMIGLAVRTALENGLHTSMQHLLIPDHTLERSRRVWSTTILLDRYISALNGLPSAVREDEISAPLPTFDGHAMQVSALDIHIKLSKVMTTIMNTVYGREGREQKRFLVHTKTALKDIAIVATELDASFQLTLCGANSGISRISAYLHILKHQCVIHATRPILFNFLEARLAHADQPPTNQRPRESVLALLEICKDAALKTLGILTTLQQQGLLESFLSFDLDAASTSVTMIQMAAHIDPILIDDHRPWIKLALSFMAEMAGRGNRIASMIKVEVERLSQILQHLPSLVCNDAFICSELTEIPFPTNIIDSAEPIALPSPIHSAEGTREYLNSAPPWHDRCDAARINLVADAIDLDDMEWWFEEGAGPMSQA